MTTEYVACPSCDAPCRKGQRFCGECKAEINPPGDDDPKHIREIVRTVLHELGVKNAPQENVPEANPEGEPGSGGASEGEAHPARRSIGEKLRDFLGTQPDPDPAPED